jgi:hypothetical protein
MEIEYRDAPLVPGDLEGPGKPLTMHVKGGSMNDDLKTVTKSSKATNNEIVKSLIAMMQTFNNLSDPEKDYVLTIDEGNLVDRVAMLIRVFQHQQDRIGDIADWIAKISRGE